MHYVDVPKGVEVYEDLSIKLTIYAPNARKVELAGWGGYLGRDPIELQEQEDHYFSVLLKGLTPGFYYHEYYVDNQKVINPLVPIGYGGFTAVNFFELPACQDDFYFLRDVDHGQVHMHFLILRSTDKQSLAMCIHHQVMKGRTWSIKTTRSCTYTMVLVKMKRDGYGREN